MRLKQLFTASQKPAEPEEIEGCRIIQLTAQQVEGLRSEDLMVDGQFPALVYGYASPDTDLARLARSIKGHCSAPLLVTSTAGELNSRARSLYLTDTSQRKNVVLQLFSTKLIDTVSAHTINYQWMTLKPGNRL